MQEKDHAIDECRKRSLGTGSEFLRSGFDSADEIMRDGPKTRGNVDQWRDETGDEAWTRC